MSVPVQTRAEREAARHDPHLVELMAEAYYRRGRVDAPSLPPWTECTEFWREACRRDMRAALVAAENAGHRIARP